MYVETYETSSKWILFFNMRFIAMFITAVCVLFLIKGTFVHIKNMCIKQLFSHKVGDFATALRVRNLFGTFEKRALER